MENEEKPTSKKIFIIIAIIMIFILIIYGVFIFICYKNSTFMFKKYIPEPDADNPLYNPMQSYSVNLNNEEEIKKAQENKNEIIYNSCRSLIEKNNIKTAYISPDGNVLVGDTPPNLVFCNNYVKNYKK